MSGTTTDARPARTQWTTVRRHRHDARSPVARLRRGPLARVACALALLVVASACSRSPEARFFALAPLDLPAPDAPASDARVVFVREVGVPQLVDRPQLVTRLDGNEVRLDDFARWAEPLPAMLTRVLADDLARLLGSARVRSGPTTITADIVVVTVALTRLDAVPGRHVLLEARCEVAFGTGLPQLLPLSLEMPWDDDRPEGLVAGMQAAVDELARRLADALGALEGQHG